VRKSLVRHGIPLTTTLSGYAGMIDGVTVRFQRPVTPFHYWEAILPGGRRITRGTTLDACVFNTISHFEVGDVTDAMKTETDD
jgi:hypothetical protein